mmetsp:Transcript_11993/g.37973  ORF Transcript_11993/g.37973 Transcript_11993/m.37973 type:complete len:80 (-) Transcript_11993:54-293(-)
MQRPNAGQGQAPGGGPPPGKGQDSGASGSGSGGGGGRDGDLTQQGEAVPVFQMDMYTAGCLLILMLMGLLKAAQTRCTC